MYCNTKHSAACLRKQSVDDLKSMFSSVLLTSNHMAISLMQFGISKHLYSFQRLQIGLVLWAQAILLAFEKFTCAYLLVPNCI